MPNNISMLEIDPHLGVQFLLLVSIFNEREMVAIFDFL